MAAPPIVQANKLTLLELIGQACGELGLLAPTQIFNNVDPQVIQLLALAQREGRDFYQYGGRKGGWQALRKQYVFNLTASDTTHTATVTLGSAVITSITPADMTGLIIVPRPLVSGAGIPYDSRLVTVNDVGVVTLDSVATVSGTLIPITFSVDTYALPSDFSYFIQMTWWDRSFRWQMMGPLSAQEWQVLKSGISPTGPRKRFRIMGNYIYIDPPPTTQESIVFEYYSNSWCQDNTAIALSAWTGDTNYYSLDDDAFILGLKWRFKAAKGLDYEQEKQDYDRQCERVLARDGGNRDLKTNIQSTDVFLLSNRNVPDTGFGT